MCICWKNSFGVKKKKCIQESLGHHKLLRSWTGQHLSAFYGSIMMLHRSYSWMLCVPALSYTMIHSLAELSCGAVQTFPGLTVLTTAHAGTPKPLSEIANRL